jgi:hypothetical protein
MKFSLVVAVLSVCLAGCETAPKSDTEAALRLMQSKDPVIREVGFLKVAEKLDVMPQQKRREIIAEMLRIPSLRTAGLRYFYAEYGITPANYPGNCPTDYNIDAAGHSCGHRSAMSRPGGY